MIIGGNMSLGLRSYRPLIQGSKHIISAGHNLAAIAGYEILQSGGNATDAGVAAGLVLNVVLPQFTSFGGVAPIIVYDKAKNETKSISGLGTWPQAASIDYFNEHHNGVLPKGILRTVMPSAADAWMTTLRMYGTKSLEEVAAPAINIAKNGFPIHYSLHNLFTKYEDKSSGDFSIREWSTTEDIFYKNGKTLNMGDILKQPDLAHTFERLVDVEKSTNGTRNEKILAARDFFYKGEMANQMVAFSKKMGGLVELEDLKNFNVQIKTPLSTNYKNTTVYSCDTWTQGPVLLQALNIVSGIDLKSMGHNSANYIHAIVESLKLCFADRHQYYGDPDFVDVPITGLLDMKYANERRSLIDFNNALPHMPHPGNPYNFMNTNKVPDPFLNPEPVVAIAESDTSYISIVDKWGNAFSATPSDGIEGAPIVEGLGFSMSARGSQAWLDPDHPASIQPGKRPRLTPTPGMAFRDGELWMSFGTPGADVQCQSMLQLLMNVIEFDMDVQQAVEAPRFATWSFPASHVPHPYEQNIVTLEDRIEESTRNTLGEMGHEIQVLNDWAPRLGSLSAIEVDRKRQVLNGSSDLRRESYAIGN
ncbi:MAG TPA: gamma-glutamyltransferase [Dehalococcoidia bacterium]|mgnify:CR=1 FL=1|nr:gamma-glutamyltransferase [Dehalococcoidia bacterium]|tara:strand:- start:733 stop:2502 length:1770 start_codon:yes stop_codon:yes gene_type:complete